MPPNIRTAGFPEYGPMRPLAGTSREWFHAFVGDSLSTCRPLRPREALRLLAPSSFADDVGLRPVGMVSALPTAPTLRFSRGVLFRGLTTVRSRYDLSICSPPVGADQVFTEPTGIFLGPRVTIRVPHSSVAPRTHWLYLSTKLPFILK
jgi:hypothetical protein